MIDKYSSIPIYVQIERFLTDGIDEGKYQDGEAIPSERELSELFKVSRMTVRQAINNLVTKGKLLKEKGKGTFVSSPRLSYALKGLVSFTEDMKHRGLTPSTKLISFKQMEKVSSTILNQLKLTQKEAVFCLHRVRYANDEPMALERAYLPVKLFSNLSVDSARGSLYEFVRNQLNYEIHHATQKIEAGLSTEVESKYLSIQQNRPVLIVRRTTYLSTGNPFEYVETVFRGEKYSFSVDVFRD
ncbi:GntR family transcriptional regulator [Alkalihalobacillus sp. AL-G]|uniref:GntR family transcriptional regulator n=1 Tax=Alkalihalobacillus sp. AL-G TaxID=2926399 RepID=UPI00272D79A3|nr:GntR family transcriptional regulator [Alkalihalobacillus sp. AL-G]WLD91938.1 GntR family transcriptional regulator [Alkalihalobacillus sp. AL-G]